MEDIIPNKKIRGAYPGASAYYSKYLDRSFVASNHLKDFVLGQGMIPSRVRVCYIGADVEGSSRILPSLRSTVRREVRVMT
jgi:hypothetical protein